MQYFLRLITDEYINKMSLDLPLLGKEGASIVVHRFLYKLNEYK